MIKYLVSLALAAYFGMAAADWLLEDLTLTKEQACRASIEHVYTDTDAERWERSCGHTAFANTLPKE